MVRLERPTACLECGDTTEARQKDREEGVMEDVTTNTDTKTNTKTLSSR